MAEEELLQELNKLFHEELHKRRELFVSSLQDAPDVAEKLLEYEIFTKNQKIAIVSKPSRQHQKEALFYILATKSFDEIDKIAAVFAETGNESLRATLKILKIKIYQRKKFNPKLLKSLPGATPDDSTVTMFSSPDIPPEGSGGQRSKSFRPSPASRIATDGIPLLPVAAFSIPEIVTLDDPEVKLEEREELDSTSLHQAASNGHLEDLSHLLNAGKQPYDPEKETGRTPLHAAVTGNNSEIAFECVKRLVSRYQELLREGTEDEIEVQRKQAEYLNHKDRDGNTIVHLAATNESVDIVRQLYQKPYYCDIFLRNNEGLSALEIMYIRTPEAIIHILNDAVPTTNNHPSDGKFTLEIDFRNVIGSHDLADSPKFSETDMLAKLVHQDKQASKSILPHIIVKTFLDLKWEKMKVWLYSSMLLQILLHLWYTFFVVQVFIINCPYSRSKRAGPPVSNKSEVPKVLTTVAEDENEERTVFSYIFGQWESVEQAFSISPKELKFQQQCLLSPSLHFQAILLLIIGVLFLLKEIFELTLVNNIFTNGTKKSKEKWRNFTSGLLAYIKSVENLFQLVYIVFMVLVCTLVFKSSISDFYYSFAALSIVIAWALILMQVGNIYGLGTYVQILGKVIKSFATLMGTYLVLIVAFSIAFSIMFPEMEPFKTLPKSLSRVIIMMTGELNYDETFYDEENSNGGPPIPLTGHIIYTSFTLLLTIVLINLLIGMVVSDVQGLRGKSEVILRSIQVEQLYVMEKSLLRFRWILLPLRKLLNRIRGNKEDKPYMGIFVINPHKTSTGMVLKKSIKDIPLNLQKELRMLAGNKDEYLKEYSKKYLNY